MTRRIGQNSKHGWSENKIKKRIKGAAEIHLGVAESTSARFQVGQADLIVNLPGFTTVVMEVKFEYEIVDLKKTLKCTEKQADRLDKANRSNRGSGMLVKGGFYKGDLLLLGGYPDCKPHAFTLCPANHYPNLVELWEKFGVPRIETKL